MKISFRKKIKLLMWLFVGLLALHFLGITAFGLLTDAHPSHVAIVLGSKVEMSGKPSRRLEERLKVGLKLYQARKVENIIVSGGIGKEGFDESRVMADYLIGQGVDSSNIIRDSLGVTTYASAVNGKMIMRENGWNSVVVVSQYFHLFRSQIAFQKIGISNVSTRGTQTYFEWRDFYAIFREIPGIYYYLVRDYS